jgi:ABC-type branched-subunit amino acid transport system ATPase component
VEEGSIAGLIGPNGAGKTTVFNLLSGLIKPDSGEILFKGEPLIMLEPHEIFKQGMARTFQLLRVFPQLTVLENLMVASPGKGERILDPLLHPRLVKKSEAAKEERCREYLRFVGLEAKADTLAGDLSYGQQKLLDIARCLATESEFILLDEPVAGVNPTLRQSIKKILKSLQEDGKTILLIEHDMGFVMDLCDEIVVLDHGDEIAIGTPAQIKKNRKVIKAYLGEE